MEGGDSVIETYHDLWVALGGLTDDQLKQPVPESIKDLLDEFAEED